MLQRLEEKYKDASRFEWDYSPENIATLSKTDIMISDFSGIIFDFVFLFNKPVIYTDAFFNLEKYDASDLDHIPWRFDVVKKFGIELMKTDLENIIAIIQKAKDNEISAAARIEAKKTAWQYIGESGKRVVDYLMNKREEIIASRRSVENHS
jgi:CDP-glycerol glycerophosphotransferase (TagB/SpsB family)